MNALALQIQGQKEQTHNSWQIGYIKHEHTIVAPVPSTSRYGASSSAVTTPPLEDMYCPICICILWKMIKLLHSSSLFIIYFSKFHIPMHTYNYIFPFLSFFFAKTHAPHKKSSLWPDPQCPTYPVRTQFGPKNIGTFCSIFFFNIKQYIIICNVFVCVCVSLRETERFHWSKL